MRNGIDITSGTNKQMTIGQKSNEDDFDDFDPYEDYRLKSKKEAQEKIIHGPKRVTPESHHTLHQPEAEVASSKVDAKGGEIASVSSSSSVSSHVIPQWDGIFDDSDAGSDLDQNWVGNTVVGDPSAVRFKLKSQTTLSSPPVPKRVGLLSLVHF